MVYYFLRVQFIVWLMPTPGKSHCRKSYLWQVTFTTNHIAARHICGKSYCKMSHYGNSHFKKYEVHIKLAKIRQVTYTTNHICGKPHCGKLHCGKSHWWQVSFSASRTVESHITASHIGSKTHLRQVIMRELTFRKIQSPQKVANIRHLILRQLSCRKIWSLRKIGKNATTYICTESNLWQVNWFWRKETTIIFLSRQINMNKTPNI